MLLTRMLHKTAFAFQITLRSLHILREFSTVNDDVIFCRLQSLLTLANATVALAVDLRPFHVLCADFYSVILAVLDEILAWIGR